MKRVPSWQNSIADLLYGRGQIKKHHSWQMFYEWRRIRMRSQKYKQMKKANNEAEYEESSVIDEVPTYLLYLNAVRIFWTDLTVHMNKRE